MIYVEDNVAIFNGSAKELTREFTLSLLSFKETLMREFDLSEDEIFNIISKCGEIAFMSIDERQEYLENLFEEKIV